MKRQGTAPGGNHPACGPTSVSASGRKTTMCSLCHSPKRLHPGPASPNSSPHGTSSRSLKDQLVRALNSVFTDFHHHQHHLAKGYQPSLDIIALPLHPPPSHIIYHFLHIFNTPSPFNQSINGCTRQEACPLARPPTATPDDHHGLVSMQVPFPF